jgi:hypothetical protein
VIGTRVLAGEMIKKVDDEDDEPVNDIESFEEAIKSD